MTSPRQKEWEFSEVGEDGEVGEANRIRPESEIASFFLNSGYRILVHLLISLSLSHKQ